MIPRFRAWIKKEKCFADGVKAVFPTLCEVGLYWRGAWGVEKFSLDDVILMQSTGLKDKNGKEIFEGDVAVMDGWRRQGVTFGTQEVEEEFGSVRIYRGFNLYLGGGYPNAVMSEFEVIGNIYENPELMEGDE